MSTIRGSAEMSAALKTAILRANLADRYFPAKHGVWDRVSQMLNRLGTDLGVDVTVACGVIADGATARRDCDRARLEATDTLGLGTIADFVFRPGPHTVFRISREANAFFQMDANVVVQDPNGFDGCRGWMDDVHIAGEPASFWDPIATVMAHGLEHHTDAVPGVHFAVLEESAA